MRIQEIEADDVSEHLRSMMPNPVGRPIEQQTALECSRLTAKSAEMWICVEDLNATRSTEPIYRVTLLLILNAKVLVHPVDQ